MVGPQRGPRRSRGEPEDVWRQIGDLLVRGHAQTDARFDRLEARLDPVEGRLDDVDGRLERIDGRLDRLESDMGDVKGQLNRLEVGYERGFKRIDAQFERLTALIIRHETGRPTDGDPLPDSP
jgi:hypothetical protein